MALVQTAFPSGRLTEPGRPEGFQNPLQIVNDLGNMISPMMLMNIQNTVRAVNGGVLDIIGSNGAFKAHPLPAGYDHPGA